MAEKLNQDIRWFPLVRDHLEQNQSDAEQKQEQKEETSDHHLCAEET